MHDAETEAHREFSSFFHFCRGPMFVLFDWVRPIALYPVQSDFSRSINEPILVTQLPIYAINSAA